MARVQACVTFFNDNALTRACYHQTDNRTAAAEMLAVYCDQVLKRSRHVDDRLTDAISDVVSARVISGRGYEAYGGTRRTRTSTFRSRSTVP